MQGAGTVDCPLTAPQGGQWRCDWPVTGANNEILQVKLHARDSFGQSAAWASPLPFLVDAAAPVVMIDITATKIISGSVVSNSAFPVYGDVADLGGVAKVEVCTSQTGTQSVSGARQPLAVRSRGTSAANEVCGQAQLQLTPGQSAVTYDDAPAGPLPIGGSCVARTFVVAENFSIGQVNLGFAAEHPRRDELQVELASPAGATVRALYDDGTASVHFANYDVLLGDAATTGLADSRGDHDPAAPYFDQTLRPYAALQAFQGQNSRGVWTLTICDRNAAANTGTYLRSRLTLTPRDTSEKAGRWSFQAPAAGQLDYVQRSLAVYAEDTVGNRTSDPLRLNVWVDNVSPAITVTTATAIVLQGRLTTVLTGTVTDGSPTADVALQILGPDGSTSIKAASRAGDRWWYDLQGETAGRYTLWAVATDQKGNTTTIGPYAVDVTCTDAGLSAAFVSAEPAASSPFSVTLAAIVSNTGTATVAAGLPVAFSAGEKPIGVAFTAQALNPGRSVTVTLDWAVDFPGDYTIQVVPNSGAAPLLTLCRQPSTARQAITIVDAPLYPSWNLVSSAVNPFNTAISTVQRPIAGKYFVIQGFDGGAKSYYPSLTPEINTLKSWDALHGYWIKANQQISESANGQMTQGASYATQSDSPVATLRLVGARFAEDHPLALAAGWNLVSYLPQTALPVTVALASIAGNYTVVQGFDHGAQSFYPGIPPILNTLQIMQPGLGYWIRTTQAVTLTYASLAVSTTVSATGLRVVSIPQPQRTQQELLAGQTERVAPIRQAEHDAGVIPTSAWVDFYGAARQADGAPLPAGSVIKALDPQGVVCGVTIVMTAGEYGPLACYSDDPDTLADEGATPADRISLVLDGQTVGTGTWPARGERQWAPLGKIIVWRSYLPIVAQEFGPLAPAGQLPAEQPSARQWFPFIVRSGQQ